MPVMLGLADLRFSCFAAQGAPAARSSQAGQNQVAVGVALHDLHGFIVFVDPTLANGRIQRLVHTAKYSVELLLHG